MSAVFSAPGAVEHYIRRRSQGGTWYYLGTAVTSPEEEAEDMLLPVMNDLGGRSLAHDYVRDRRRCVVTTTLNRLNRTTYRRLRNENVLSTSASEYVEGPLLNGLLTNEVSSFELLLVNTFVAAGLGASADQPVGRCYYCAIPRKFRETRQGSRVIEASVLFECVGLFDAASRQFEVYTEDPSYWGVVTPE